MNRETLHALADAIADALASAGDAARYYDQDTTPLPKDAHLRLVRKGVLKGYKAHGRVYVKRDDVHAYIEAHAVEPMPVADEPDAETTAVSGLLGTLGLKKVG